MNLSNLPNLQVISLSAVLSNGKQRIKRWHDPPRESSTLDDINTVLATIPVRNRMTNLWFDFLTDCSPPFDECLDQDWVGMFNEIIRIGGEKPLELEIKMEVCLATRPDELHMRIVEKATLLSDYPNICTHWWNPTPRSRGHYDQARTRCRR